MPLAFEGIRLLTQPSTSLMTPSAFHGGGVQVNAIANITIQSKEHARKDRPTRTVTFQDSYDALTQSSSRDPTPKREPNCLVGFQKDLQLQERQRQQQRVENKAANAPIDLRDKLNAGKRARDLGEQSSSNTNRDLSAPSPTKPEARRQKIAREWLTSAKTQQLEITAKDAVRLQRELPVKTEKGNP